LSFLLPHFAPLARPVSDGRPPPSFPLFRRSVERAGVEEFFRSSLVFASTLSLLIAGLLVSSTAQANGRFPAAGQLVVNPLDSQRLVVSTTFGVVQTVDRGGHWSWICEEAIGFSGNEDPSLGLFGDGTVTAGLFKGLSISQGDTCSWSLNNNPLQDQYVIDVTVHPFQPSHGLAITSSGTIQSSDVRLAETTDNGHHWAYVGPQLPSDFLALSIELAPSDANRLYVSGYFSADIDGAVERSDDHGQSWQRFPINLDGAPDTYIGAVDPSDPDIVYLRANGQVFDSLYRSTDGAQTWTKIFQEQGELLGFALSPDGLNVAIGGPMIGIYIASTQDFQFKKVSNVQALCLKWRTEGLYACGDEYKDSFSLGISTDMGKTFQALYHLPQVDIIDCPSGTSVNPLCMVTWPNVKQKITNMGAGDAGTVGTYNNDAGVSSAPPAPGPSGCGCSVPRHSENHGNFLALLVAVVAVVRRRRQATCS
jgi:MYXO-CTERM domain-containing protein